MTSSPSPPPALRPTSWALPPSLPSPSRGSFEAPSSPAKENWTVSTLGFLSGIFDIESPEDDDDLLVPSTHRTLTAPNDVREPAPAAAQKRPAASQRRSCSSAIQAFLNEQALDEVVEPAHEKSSGLTLTLASTAMELDPSLLVTPPATANPLGLDWMNQSLSPDEFGDLLQEFDQEASASAASFPAPPLAVSPFAEHDVCTTVIDVSEVSFESLLSTQLPLLPTPFVSATPAPIPAPASAAPAPKKRGRPAKPAPTLQVTPRKAAAPAPEKAREPSPATPFSPPPCTPGGGLSGTARPSPDDKEAYERYLRYRRTNNGSAQKSRLRRKEREKMNADMVGTLQEQNSELKRELALLKGEFQQLQNMLDNYLQQQAKAN